MLQDCSLPMIWRHSWTWFGTYRFIKIISPSIYVQVPQVVPILQVFTLKFCFLFCTVNKTS